MLTRTHAIISVSDTDESHDIVHVAGESVIDLSFITEVVASVTLWSWRHCDDNNDYKLSHN